MYGTIREGRSFERLIIDERDSRKIVIETLRLYQGEKRQFLLRFSQRPPFSSKLTEAYLEK